MTKTITWQPWESVLEDLAAIRKAGGAGLPYEGSDATMGGSREEQDSSGTFADRPRATMSRPGTRRAAWVDAHGSPSPAEISAAAARLAASDQPLACGACGAAIQGAWIPFCATCDAPLFVNPRSDGGEAPSLYKRKEWSPLDHLAEPITDHEARKLRTNTEKAETHQAKIDKAVRDNPAAYAAHVDSVSRMSPGGALLSASVALAKAAMERAEANEAEAARPKSRLERMARMLVKKSEGSVSFSDAVEQIMKDLREEDPALARDAWAEHMRVAAVAVS